MEPVWAFIAFVLRIAPAGVGLFCVSIAALLFFRAGRQVRPEKRLALRVIGAALLFFGALALWVFVQIMFLRTH